MTTTRSDHVPSATPRERVAEIIERIRRHWTGRTVVLLVNRYGGATRALAEELEASGARIGAVVAGSRLDPRATLASPVWNCADHGIRLSMRDFDTWLRDPAPELASWLDALDPGRSWPVIGTSYTDVPQVCGRSVNGWWRREWAQWEDKTRVDELWRQAAVPAPDHEVLPASDANAVRAAVGRLDLGCGTVIAADASRAFLGSSKGLRWVRDAEETEEAVRHFGGTTDRVRVATFVPGTPCSILGMVLPSGVAVFEPFEIVTLGDPRTGRLLYAGSSTWWRTSPEAREAMRESTRRAGWELAETCGYRGIYSVDGILGPEGFFATELNPRHVSGLSLWAGWPEFPVRLFNRAVQEQVPEFLDVDPVAVETAFNDVIRRNPAYTVRVPVSAVLGDQASAVRESSLTTVTDPRPVTQRVRFEVLPDALRLLNLTPVLPDGTAAPAAAALANAFGMPGLTYFPDGARHPA
ncbi:hypothetical protein AB0L65_17210 [Nonomuraea sp. NPDC052116]|uniref:hypothetical protein n=1 Tax=Nonomuraea sp. NPDC052116 TaxID=3155665 RepID=UPI00343751D6